MARSRDLEQFLKRLDAIPAEVKKAVQPALATSGKEMTDMMRKFVPKDTHALEQSIVATPAGQTTPAYSQPGGSTVVPANAVMITAGDEKVRYAHLVEHGTAVAKAKPYFWVSYRLLRNRVQNRLKRAISKAVKDGWSK